MGRLSCCPILFHGDLAYIFGSLLSDHYELVSVVFGAVVVDAAGVSAAGAVLAFAIQVDTFPALARSVSESPSGSGVRH